MNKICKHCKEEKLKESEYQLVMGDLTCCGEKNDNTFKKCRKKGHIVYVCYGKHYGEEGDEIGPIIFKHENG